MYYKIDYQEMIVVIQEAKDNLVLFLNSDTPFAREKGATLKGLLEFGACLKKMIYEETDSIDWLGLIKWPFYGTEVQNRFPEQEWVPFVVFFNSPVSQGFLGHKEYLNNK